MAQKEDLKAWSKEKQPWHEKRRGRNPLNQEFGEAGKLLWFLLAAGGQWWRRYPIEGKLFKRFRTMAGPPWRQSCRSRMEHVSCLIGIGGTTIVSRRKQSKFQDLTEYSVDGEVGEEPRKLERGESMKLEIWEIWTRLGDWEIGRSGDWRIAVCYTIEF